jgi:hypothetical protein
VKTPLVLYQGKVLDGRNRLYFASTLKKPVQLKEFDGTEDEAKRHVAALNLARRHLNPQQLAIAAINLFGEEAAKETLRAYQLKVGRAKKTGNESPPTLAAIKRPSREAEWHEVVARRANEVGLNTTPAAIKAMKNVVAAPETKAAVEAGEITTAAEAIRRARSEKGKPKPLPRDANAGNLFNRLSTIVQNFVAITGEQMPNAQSVSERLDQIEQLVPRVRRALREQRVIV